MATSIESSGQWVELRDRGFGTVLDPMVLRCGDLFLAGGRAVGTRGWSFLSRNVDALGIFFDALILNEKLPVFNYGDTYEMRLNFDERALTRINQYEPVLHDFYVGYGPYHEVKDAALAELAKVTEGPGRVPRELGEEILSELSAAEYEWNPGLEDLEMRLGSDEERRLGAFLLGGLIFGGYAQQMGGEHLLQPKRSRLFLAVSLRSKSADHRLEELLFRELKERANARSDDLPWRPTFLPYLLAKADTPAGILREVVTLRRSTEVVEYRAWLREVVHDWRTNGRLSREHRQDVQAVASAIRRKLGEIPSLPRVELKVTVADIAKPKVPGGLDLTPALQRMWGWMLASLPGNRYRKLLTRAVVADHEYVLLERRIESVWRVG